ncbi:MAG: WD40 repeat domain-containing protein, partial [Candidatus Eremiobacteraeota bacterium]|nr:WD40 repeat domain-containing protein [Candidatus Eremiobacteraeota bacterium]
KGVSTVKKLIVILIGLSILSMHPLPGLDIPEPISLTTWKVAVSPDGNMVAFASSDGCIRLFDMENDKIKNVLCGHNDAVSSVAFSPGGELLASGGLDGKIIIHEMGTQNQVIFPREHEGPIVSINFSPDGKFIVSAGNDKMIKLWDVDSHSQVKAFKGPDEYPTMAIFNNKGDRILASSWDDNIYEWDIENGKLTRKFSGHGDSVNDIDLSPDGKNLVSSSCDMTVRVWDTRTGEEISRAPLPESVIPVTWSPDGEIIAAGAWNNIYLFKKGENRYYKTLKGHNDAIRSLVFTPDGSRLVSSSSDESARIWDIKSGNCLAVLFSPSLTVRDVDVFPDEKTAISGSNEGLLEIFDIIAGKQTSFIPQTSGVSSVTTSPDGKTFACGLRDGTLLIYDTQTRKILIDFRAHRDIITGLEYSPDGNYIATAGADDQAKIWELNGKLFRTLIRHNDSLTDITWSPDGKNVTTSSWDGRAIIWNVKSGKPYRILKGHTGCISGVSFSPDGSILGTASFDGTVRLWDVKSGKLLEDKIVHNREISSISFASNGLYTGSFDHTAKRLAPKTLTTISVYDTGDHWVTAISPFENGKKLLLGMGNGSLQVWSTEKAECILKIPVNPPEIPGEENRS